MVPGQNQPQTLNYDKCQKMTYMYRLKQDQIGILK